MQNTSSHILQQLLSRSTHLKPDEEQTRVWIREYQDTKSSPAHKAQLEYNVLQMHIRFGVMSIRRHRYKHSVEDDLSILYISLKKTMERFELTRDTKFNTYWDWWIRASVIRAHHDTEYRTIRIPVHQIDRFYRIRKALATRPELHQLTSDQLALELGEKTETIALYHEWCMRKYTPSLDAPLGDDDERTLSEIIGGERDSQESEDLVILRSSAEQIHRFIEKLSSLLLDQVDLRKIDAFVHRHLIGYTLLETAIRQGLSRERIRQITEEVGRLSTQHLSFNKGLRVLFDLAKLYRVLEDQRYAAPSNHPFLLQLRIFAPHQDDLECYELGHGGFGLDRLSSFLEAMDRLKPLVHREVFRHTVDEGVARTRAATRDASVTVKIPHDIDELVQTLRNIFIDDNVEGGERYFFLHGRELLHTYYGETMCVDHLLDEAVRTGRLVCLQNSWQGEALSFVMVDPPQIRSKKHSKSNSDEPMDEPRGSENISVTHTKLSALPGNRLLPSVPLVKSTRSTSESKVRNKPPKKEVTPKVPKEPKTKPPPKPPRQPIPLLTDEAFAQLLAERKALVQQRIYLRSRVEQHQITLSALRILLL